MTDTCEVGADAIQTPRLDDATRLKPLQGDVTRLPLTPDDFFVFSNLLGPMSLADLRKRCGGLDTVEASVARLVELGAVQVQESSSAVVGNAGPVAETEGSGGQKVAAGAEGPVADAVRTRPRQRSSGRSVQRVRIRGSEDRSGGASASAHTSRPPTANADASATSSPRTQRATGGRSRSENRRAGRADSAGAGESATPENSAGSVAQPGRTETQTRSRRARASQGGAAENSGEALPPPSGIPQVAPVAADDPRIDAAIGLDVEFQRLVLAAADAGQSLNAFRTLGIAPTEDERRIKRAFHALSRKLHPDAYFGRELGEFELLLERLFTHGKRSFTLLRDRASRDQAMTSWFEEETAGRETATRQAAEAESMALARRKLEARDRADRNAARNRRRERRRAQTSVSAREQQAATIRGEAEHLRGSGRLGEAMRAVARARGLVPDGSNVADQLDRDMSLLRKERGTRAFDKAIEARKAGNSKEAQAFFEEAAEFCPTIRHLSEAAMVCSNSHPARARDFAMNALKLLARDRASERLSTALEGRVHYCCAFAFKRAGLLKSAATEARLAERSLGRTAEVSSLLKGLGLT